MVTLIVTSIESEGADTHLLAIRIQARPIMQGIGFPETQISRIFSSLLLLLQKYMYI